MEACVLDAASRYTLSFCIVKNTNQDVHCLCEMSGVPISILVVNLHSM